MQIKLLVAVLATSFSLSRSNAEVGVQSGNIEGLSEVAYAQEMTIPRPPPVQSITAVRINKDFVKVSLNGVPSVANGMVRVMRTTGTGGWMQVGLWQTGSAPADFLSLAPAGTTYKYLAQVSALASGYGRVYSQPTSIAYVEDVPATLLAGETSYIPPFWWPATGTFSVTGFWSASATSADNQIDSDPFSLTGPFAQSKSEFGFIRCRIPLSAEASIQTQFFIPYGFATIDTDAAWSNFLTEGGSLAEGEGMHFALSSEFGFYESRWSGNAEYGYDAASNPNWQMIPSQSGDTRAVSLSIEPEIGNWSTSLQGLGLELSHLGGTPVLGVSPGSTSILVSHNGGPFGNSSSEMLPAGLRVPLNVDVRPKVDLKIKVVRVLLRQRRNGVLFDENPTQVPDPDITALESELNTVFGSQANIYFTVDKTETYHDDDDDESVPDEDTDGIPMFDALHGTVAGGSYYTDLARYYRNNGYIFTIFCCRLAKYIQRQGGSPSLALGGFANGKDDTAAFAVITPLVGSGLDTYSHEIGHLLGLDHTWTVQSGYSEAELPDSPRGRLMCYDRTGYRLVKPERDVVHARAKFFLQRMGLLPSDPD